MNKDDIKYRQGRSSRQWNANEAIAFAGYAGLVVSLIIILLINIF